MKINNKTSFSTTTYTLIAGLLFTAVQTLTPASAEYQGYWVDHVNAYQANQAVQGSASAPTATAYTPSNRVAYDHANQVPAYTAMQDLPGYMEEQPYYGQQ